MRSVGHAFVFLTVLTIPAISRGEDGLRPLSPRWSAALDLHSPVNVVVGRVESEARLCVQGSRFFGARQRAGVEMLDARGRRVWRDDHGEAEIDFIPGAYVQWLSGGGMPDEAVLYSFCPNVEDRRGGARLLRARDGALLKTIENTTRFGNNNSLAADLDGDGRLKLLYADQQSLTCYALPGLDRQWRWQEGINFCWSLPALVDLDDDGRVEIVFGSEYNNQDGTSSMIALDRNGKQLWRSDGHADDLGSTPVVVADVDGDSQPELLKVGLDLEHRRQMTWNHLYVFDRRGKPLRKIELGCTGLAIGDMDGDGRLEGVGLTNTRDGGNNGRKAIRCVDLVSGDLKWSVDVERAYLDTNSPLMLDLLGNGTRHAVVGTGNPAGYARLRGSQPWGDLYVVDHRGKVAQHEPLPGWPVNLACCDLEGDGKAELIAVIDGKPGRLAVWNTGAATSRRVWHSPFGNAARNGAIRP